MPDRLVQLADVDADDLAVHAGQRVDLLHVFVGDVGGGLRAHVLDLGHAPAGMTTTTRSKGNAIGFIRPSRAVIMRRPVSSRPGRVMIDPRQRITGQTPVTTQTLDMPVTTAAQ